MLPGQLVTPDGFLQTCRLVKRAQSLLLIFILQLEFLGPVSILLESPMPRRWLLSTLIQKHLFSNGPILVSSLTIKQ